MNSLKNNLIPYSFLLFAFLGFVDSTFLAVLHYKNITPPCTITQGCEKVLTSQYATINEIPIAVLGSIYFTVLIILGILLLQNNKKWLKKAILIFTSMGMVVALILLYIQLVILQALCQYCFLVELILFLLFWASIKVYFSSSSR
ncbi:MAG: vitamin K epoxide reductase family protein [Candidatus Levybacteria bacterium]|nr:vitamin K epoxide reductase family protein [Candidatus Levybacteria bacterium]